MRSGTAQHMIWQKCERAGSGQSKGPLAWPSKVGCCIQQPNSQVCAAHVPNRDHDGGGRLGCKARRLSLHEPQYWWAPVLASPCLDLLA